MRTVVLVALLAISQAPVSVELEPQHRLALVNDYVRVLDVIFPPGYTTLFHTHSLDNVSVRFTAGTSRTDRPDARGTPAPVIPGTVAFNGASPPYTHRIQNTGTTTIHILDVQLVKGTAAASAADALASHEIVIENGRVRVSRVKLAAGGVLPAHSHPHGWVETVVAGAGAGSFRWRNAGAAVPALNGPVEVVEIEPKD
jgi:quercetin dioxygenase-like cupin family protein